MTRAEGSEGGPSTSLLCRIAFWAGLVNPATYTEPMTLGAWSTFTTYINRALSLVFFKNHTTSIHT